ncbi:hypothetical protein DV736_g4618, partial [Chaetothyriales sp. CBS 134916]
MSRNNIGSYPNNVPTHPDLMNCVYAISGSYGLLPRIVYYLTLVFAIFGRRQEWLVLGALVSAMVFSATTAIHQMALTSSKSEQFDLDIVGAWAVLSTGALAYIPMMHWSTTLMQSRARLILVAWGVLVGSALIFGRSALFDTALSDPEPACYSSSGMLLEYPLQIEGSLFNCTYKCFSLTKPMRQQSEVMAVPQSLLTGKYFQFTKVLVGPIQFAAYAAISTDSTGRTPSQMCVQVVMKYLLTDQNDDRVKSIYNAAQEVPYGGYVLFFHYFRKARWSRQKAVVYLFALPMLTLGLLVDLCALPLMVVNIVLNEIVIMSAPLPANEASYAIGQWGPWVSAALVLIAAVMSRVLNARECAKEARLQAREDSSSHELEPVYAVDVEAVHTQTVGVIKPKLAHVPTLPLALADLEALGPRPRR